VAERGTEEEAEAAGLSAWMEWRDGWGFSSFSKVVLFLRVGTRRYIRRDVMWVESVKRAERVERIWEGGD
jgi:tRNA A37 N6-isopentenylltransferase MiaA